MEFEPRHISRPDFEAIELYLQGTLGKDRREAFEERMAEDEGFRQTVQYYSNLVEGVEAAGLQSRLDEYHAAMEKVNGEAGPAPNSKNSGSFLKYLVAASVLVAVGLATWYVAFQQPSQEELFAAYFVPDPGLITPMSSTENYDFYSGMIDYKRENYQKAIDTWEPLLQEQAKKDTLQYFIGVAYLALGQANEALPYLQESTANSSSAFIDEAYYYTALAYIKTGNNQAAIQAIQKSDSERSRQLQAELEKRK